MPALHGGGHDQMEPDVVVHGVRHRGSGVDGRAGPWYVPHAYVMLPNYPFTGRNHLPVCTIIERGPRMRSNEML